MLERKLHPLRVLWIGSCPTESATLVRFDNVLTATAAEGCAHLEREEFDAVLVSVPLPDWEDEATLVEEIHYIRPNVPVIVRAPHAPLRTAVALMQRGAFHVFDEGDPASALSRAACVCPKAPLSELWRARLVGESLPMQRVADHIRLVAQHPTTVLVRGETGTGKEVAARAIHAASKRAGMPLVSVNCTAFPDTLLEAELFGHVKGAFTGAVNARIGRFEQANKGTIFLDEVGDMPVNLQAKLLRVLQEREIQRLGSSETVRIDVRVIAATNADLEERICDGRFREDLYYRLNVVSLDLPALRDRKADVAALANHFVTKVCARLDCGPKQLTSEAVRSLLSYDWPGNVRQLENSVEKAVVLSGNRSLLYPADLNLPKSRRPALVSASVNPSIRVPDEGLNFEETVGSIEREILQQALDKACGNKKAAADMLGLKRTTLAAKLKSLAAAS